MTTSSQRGPQAGLRPAPRPGHRVAGALALGGAAALAGVLALAACGGGALSGTSGGGGSAAGHRNAPALPSPASAGRAYGAAGRQPGAPSGKLLLASQSIIYTANVTERVPAVQDAVAAVTAITTAAGGYVASEQMSAPPGSAGITSATLTLEIPVAAYPAAWSKLLSNGKLIAVGQQATNVTQQVADVASRVSSEQSAIRQLRALLARAGSVTALLSVQDQINTEQSALESLLAQQRSLAHETSYATVSMLLLPRPHPVARHHQHSRNGFAAGLAAGWRALRTATVALLAALGAALPFAVVLAVLAALAGAGYRRFRRRQPGPAATPE